MRAWAVDLALLAAGRWPVDRQRLGLQCPVAQPGSVWIHGASLGECRLARRLGSALNDRGVDAFVTADTSAGRLLADAYRPVDHPSALAAAFAEVRPQALVFIENAWYPALAARASDAGIPVIAVGARTGTHVGIRGRLLGWPDAVWAMDEQTAALHAANGVEVWGIGGSLKGGAPTGPSPLGDACPPFIVGVCTHPGEEAALIAARDEVCPDTAILLAPRDLSRVNALLKQFPTFARRSSVRRWTQGDLLLDTFGELPRLLVGARAAFVGGTFDAAVGGHSPREALDAGVPVVHGPRITRNALDFEGCTRVSALQGLAEGLNGALKRGDRPVSRAARPVPERVAERLLDAIEGPSSEVAPRPWLRHLQIVPELGIRARRLLPRRTAPVPVIAVGSDNARGSGKTSTALWIAKMLRRAGHRVGVITRGVGRIRGRDVGNSLQHGPDARWLGDEGALMALEGFVVVAHPDRWRAAAQLSGCSVWLLEDGLQTGGIEVGLRVATMDARFPNGRGRIPSGERRPQIADPDIVVVHHGTHPCSDVVARRRSGPWAPRAPTGDLLAFAGIGRAADFFASLRVDRGSRPEHAIDTVRFSDHHRYTPDALQELVRRAAGRTLVTTDRDAVRIEPEVRDALGLCWRGVSLEIEGFPLHRLPAVDGR